MQDHEIPEPFGALVDLAREVAECSTTRETPGVAIDDTWDEIVGQARVALAALRAAPPAGAVEDAWDFAQERDTLNAVLGIYREARRLGEPPSAAWTAVKGWAENRIKNAQRTAERAAGGGKGGDDA